MADEEKQRDWPLDAMLDTLLRSYSVADPRPGFETRMRAVVNAQAVRVRRTNWLLLAASAAAIFLFAWAMIATKRPAKPPIDTAVVKAPIPAPPPTVNPVPSTGKQARRANAGDRPAQVQKHVDSRIVLELVKDTQGSGNLVFEREKLYLTPETRPEPAPTVTAAEQVQAQAPAPVPVVSIQSIGVASMESSAPIEIKDLAPPKSSNEKGSL